MNPETVENKAGRQAEKMERALNFVKGMKQISRNKNSSIPRRGSLRVVSQMKREELIG